MRVIYSIAVNLGYQGLGNVARIDIEALHSRGYLLKAVAASTAIKYPPFCLETPHLPSALFRIRNYTLRDTLFDLWAASRVETCDVFYGWAHHALYSARRAKKLGARTILYRACPHILSQRNLIEEEYRLCGMRLPSNISWRVVDRMLQEYEEADLIVVPSSFSRDSFLAHDVPAGKLRVNLLGAVQPSVQQRPLVDNGVFRALFVGGAVVRKGVKWLLEAWANLDLPNAELVLRAPLNEELKVLLKPYSQRDDIKVVGHVDDINELYRTASVFAFPSSEDGFGMVVTEAMACGLPVIISENVGAKDIVRQGVDGFILPIRDADQIAEKLAYLYTNPHVRHQMGLAAQERVAEFTWTRSQARLIGIVEEIRNAKLD